MLNRARLILAALALAGCQAGPQPPVAKRIPHVTTIHGDRLVDNYHWLRQKDSPAVLAYLKAENDYSDRYMNPTGRLQNSLYQEMLGHIQETDTSVAYREGEWLYYERTEEKKQYPIYCRKYRTLGSPEQIVLDLNVLGEGLPHIELGVGEVSDDGQLLAYTVDTTGFQEFTLYVKDLRTGALLTEAISNVVGCAWAADNRTFFYTTEDDAKRSHRLWRHELGATRDELIYEEKDELFNLGLSRSRSKAYFFVESASKTTAEIRYLRADSPGGEWKVLEPRAKDHEYDVDHAGDAFIIRTNDKGKNFRLVTVPVSDPRRENWQELVPHREDVALDDAVVFADHIVLVERADGLPRFRIGDTILAMPEPAYLIAPEHNMVFQTNVFRYSYESLRAPLSIYEFDVTTGQSKLLKQQPVKNYDPGQYEVKRLFATASDGGRIPVSLVRRKDVTSGPLLLDGYGAYGIPEDVWFSSQRLCLLDRGVTFAIAHVRGGGEYGKRWHDAGKMMQKRNSFTDFIACAEFLIQEGYTTREQLAITGGSAGGLLMGAVLNLRPDLCRAALIEVPFMDAINTMLDESLPLTVPEFEEWGNPKIESQYRYIKSYSPYDNVSRTNYPAMLVRTSLNDSRVMYWEPAKYVAKLRACKTDRNPLLLKIDLEPAGHSGKSGRYDALRDLAFDYAFLLRVWFGDENLDGHGHVGMIGEVGVERQ